MRALVVVLLVLLAPASAHAYGIQKTFTAPGMTFGGENTVFPSVALAPDGTLWTSAVTRGALYHHSPVGAVLGTITTQLVGGSPRPSQGVALDTANGHVYAMLGGQHQVHHITEYGTDGLPIRSFGGSEFPGDFHEGAGVAVDAATKQVYATGRSGGGKIVRFAADGTVIRSLNTGGSPYDIDVDPATGDVLVAFEGAGVVRRYDSSLDNARVIHTGAGPVGVSLAPDGDLWVAHRDGAIERRSPAGALLGTTTIPGGQVYDVDADGKGGAWVSAGSLNVSYYVGTDAPVPSFSANPGGAVPTGTRVTFTSTATDADGTIAARAWDLDGDGVYADGTGETAARTFATAGTYVVRQRVTDNDGAVGERALTVVVSAQAPTAQFTVTPGATYSFTSTTTDPDGTIVSTEWDLDDDGAFDDATGPTASRAYGPGTHHVRVRVTDNDGTFAVREHVFTIGGGLTAADTAVDEGAPLRFPVRLDAARGEAVYVDYETSTGLFGTLVFAPGQTLKHVLVTTVADGIDTDDRTVGLSLSEPVGAPLSTPTATGTIRDTDAAPRFATDPVAVDERAGTATFTIRLEGPATARTLTGTLGGRAFTVTPPARSTTVDIPVTDDTVAEPDEVITLTGDLTTTLTIRDDEPSAITLGAPPAVIPESGGPVTITVQQPVRSVPVTLPWTLTGGSNEHTTDWQEKAGTVTFAAGATSAEVTLVPVDDSVHEAAPEPWVLTVGEQTVAVPMSSDEGSPIPYARAGDPIPVYRPNGPTSSVEIAWTHRSEVERYAYNTEGWTRNANTNPPIVIHYFGSTPDQGTARPSAVDFHCGGPTQPESRVPRAAFAYVSAARARGGELGTIARFPFIAYRPACYPPEVTYRAGDTFRCEAYNPVTARGAWSYTVTMRYSGTGTELASETWTGGPFNATAMGSFPAYQTRVVSRRLTDEDVGKRLECVQRTLVDGVERPFNGLNTTESIAVRRTDPVVPGSARVIVPSGGIAEVKGNTVGLPVQCTKTNCTGTATLQLSSAKAKASAVTVLGKASFRAKKGAKKANARIKLNAAGKQLLAASGEPLRVAAVVKAGGRTTTVQVSLRPKAKA